MVAIHDISLDTFAGSTAEGAVAFFLSQPARRNRVHAFHDDGWEVELRQGRAYAVARTNRTLAGTDLVDKGISSVHMALDLSSVEDGDHLLTKEPADQHIAVEMSEGGREVRIQDICDFAPSIEIAATTYTRADGTTVPDRPRPEVAWSPAFRFHRLSQASADVFEAFRNLYLGLEALLDEHFPQDRKDRGGKAEGEWNWLVRALRQAEVKVNLSRLAAPGSKDPANDLAKAIYDIRVKLFHAKTGLFLIPNDELSLTKVSKMYPVLLELWSQIAWNWSSVQQRGGGGFTHAGFRMAAGVFSSARAAVTADDTPFDKGNAAPSPRGLPVATFPGTIDIVEVAPGRMALRARTDVPGMPAGQVVGRNLVMSVAGEVLVAGTIRGGITLEGADVLEVATTLRLVNRDQPRIEF